MCVALCKLCLMAKKDHWHCWHFALSAS